MLKRARVWLGILLLAGLAGAAGADVLVGEARYCRVAASTLRERAVFRALFCFSAALVLAGSLFQIGRDWVRLRRARP